MNAPFDLTKAESLENHSLGEIQTWRDTDEQEVRVVRQALTTTGELPQDLAVAMT